MNRPRSLHLGELLIDVAIVAGSAWYVDAASHYPPQGRQMPVLIGYIAIGLGVLHLVAHAVPRLWAVTHDSAARRRPLRQAPERAGADPREAADADGAAPAPAGLKASHGETRQVAYAMAWVVGLLTGVYVLGYAIAIPVFFLAYFGAMRAWRTAVISAVVMGVVTQGLFVTALAVPLPQGLL